MLVQRSVIVILKAPGRPREIQKRNPCALLCKLLLTPNPPILQERRTKCIQPDVSKTKALTSRRDLSFPYNKSRSSHGFFNYNLKENTWLFTSTMQRKDMLRHRCNFILISEERFILLLFFSFLKLRSSDVLRAW